MHSPSFYLVIDLEATCFNDGAVPRNEMEIIEIGAVMVDAESLEPLDELQSFVRPRLHHYLTDFCRALTQIRQRDVDGGDHFTTVLDRLVRWADYYAGFLFSSWGDYDRKQLKQDCQHHDVPYPFGPHHLNLKKAFSRRQGLRRRLGMAAALRTVGLELRGTHHRALDDARNIARLLPLIVG